MPTRAGVALATVAVGDDKRPSPSIQERRKVARAWVCLLFVLPARSCLTWQQAFLSTSRVARRLFTGFCMVHCSTPILGQRNSHPACYHPATFSGSFILGFYCWIQRPSSCMFPWGAGVVSRHCRPTKQQPVKESVNSPPVPPPKKKYSGDEAKNRSSTSTMISRYL
jgi:hypothetical protein